LSAHACGPDFQQPVGSRRRSAAVGTGQQVRRELGTADILRRGRFKSVPATNGYDAQTIDAEMADLTAALKKAKFSPAESAWIVKAHRANRKKLQEYLDYYAVRFQSWIVADGTTQDSQVATADISVVRRSDWLAG